MKGIRIASRYAKSLLSLSLEKGKVDEVYADMQLVGTTIHQSRDLELLLLSPVIKTDTKVKVLTLVFGSKIGEISNAFLTLLTKKGREGMLGEIAQSFVDQVKAHKQIVSAKLVTAAPIDAETRSTINALATKLAAGKSVELVEKVDETLIGGFILNVGDQQIDASISGEIKSLKREFEKNPYVPEI
jgi:F-type H+-transporting ATPase subunit delta